jgi:hypothetical protein
MFPRPSPVRNAVARRTRGRWEVGERLSGASLICVIFLQIFQRGGRTFPTFPTFPIPLTVFGFFGGTCRGRLIIRDTTFPGWCGVTFVDELPLLRLMAHARGIDPQGQRANMKDAVAHPSQPLCRAAFSGNDRCPRQAEPSSPIRGSMPRSGRSALGCASERCERRGQVSRPRAVQPYRQAIVLLQARPPIRKN